MKKLFTLILLTLSFNVFADGLYQYNLKSTSGKSIKLADYKDKAVLIVNIATRCGYTTQLEGLEKIYKDYKDKGLTVIGVPSNDFGGQTPEKNEEVAKFCKLKYGVTFPLSEKTVVKGKDKSPLYKYLTGITDNSEISWNFTKFLFDKKGKLVKRYSSSVAPSNEDFNKDIKKAIK
jgi:glutathione peroxidase